LFTFHSIRSQCEQGSREAWQAFLGDYTPVVLKLLEIYWPNRPERHKEIWQEALRSLGANNFERLRALSRQAEREFLVELQAFVFERVAAEPSAQAESSEAPGPTREAVHTLLEGLPLLHQEVLFLKLAGYSDGTLEKLLRVSPGVAQKALERLPGEYSAVLGREQDKSLWPTAWSGVLRQAQAAKTDDCPPLHRFVSILDGQTTWHDKEPAERHVAGCLHCLERWTAVREVTHWRLEAKPAPAAELEALLSCLPIEVKAISRKSFFARVFGG
jgi:hypothetical protein